MGKGNVITSENNTASPQGLGCVSDGRIRRLRNAVATSPLLYTEGARRCKKKLCWHYRQIVFGGFCELEEEDATSTCFEHEKGTKEHNTWSTVTVEGLKDVLIVQSEI